MENENDLEIGKMILNDAGKMIENEWLALKKRFLNIELHDYVVMPNHFHAILEIGRDIGQPQGIAPTAALKNEVHDNSIETIRSSKENMQPQGVIYTASEKNKRVGDIIGAFKSITTVEYIRGVTTQGWKPFKGKLWQRNYWEHIIRNELAYFNISNYIIKNPMNWKEDEDNWVKFK